MVEITLVSTIGQGSIIYSGQLVDKLISSGGDNTFFLAGHAILLPSYHHYNTTEKKQL
jgi:hypothetical protein